MNTQVIEKLNKIDKSSPIPLYHQLKTAITQLVKEGALIVGDEVPSENEIAARTNVSRPTIRQAMNELVAEGLLVRHRGRGTYVSSPKIEARHFQHLQTFNEEMRQKGMSPSSRVLEHKLIDGIPHINLELGAATTDQLIYLHRLRCADREPILLAQSYIPYLRFPQLLEVDFATSSLLECFRDLYGKPLRHVVRYVEAIICPAEEARLLQICAGDPLCRVCSCAYSDGDQPLEYTIALYRGDRTKFRVEMFKQD